MLYLIGVNHVLQHESTQHNLSKIVRDKRASFKAHVLEVIKKFGISVLAEEFSEQAKKKPLMESVGETTLEHIARHKRIEHRFCDPTVAERKENEIEQSDSEKREQFWLSRIQDYKNKNVLFVCGDDHFQSFGEKLTAAGFDVKHGPRWDINEDEWSIIVHEIWAAS